MDTIYSNCRNILSIFIIVSQLCNFLKHFTVSFSVLTLRIDFVPLSPKNITCLHCIHI